MGDEWAYRSVSLRSGIVDKIEFFIKESEGKYRSVAEFVTDAVRRRLEDEGVF